MQFLQKPIDILEKKSTYYCLLLLVGVVSLLLWWLNKEVKSGDYYTYLYYIKGLEKGEYSYWYFLNEYIPDTFRNPGYPFFLYALHAIHPSVHFVQFVQWVLLMLSLVLTLRIIDYYASSYLLKNIFLLFVLFNFVTLSYSAYIFPENLVLCTITTILYVELIWKSNWKKTFVLIILYAFCFQLRPIILFIPFLRFAYYLFNTSKEKLHYNIVFLVLFIASLLPYAFWNQKQHGVFKITPLEGGGGVMYLSYWSPKMLNVVETRYWRNVMNEDALINFVDKKEVSHNVLLFNNEFDSIERICSQYLTAKDTLVLNIMKQHPYLFVTYNSKYTLERERLLKTLAVQHFLQDIGYTIKVKVYTFFRLWYTGLTKAQLHSTNPIYKSSSILAFATTFSTLLLLLFYFLWALIQHRTILYKIALPLLLCIYFAGIHVPFAIQSRYTIPVRFLYLFVIAYLIYSIHFKKSPTQTNA